MKSSRKKDPVHSSLTVSAAALEAERAVIGGLFIDGTRFDGVSEIINENDFVIAPHKIIYTGMREMVERGERIDPVLVAEHLERQGQLEQVGGMPYLGQILDSTASAANVVSYAKVVREYSLRRRIAGLGAKMSTDAVAPKGQESAALLDAAEAELRELQSAVIDGAYEPSSMRDLLIKNIDKIDTLFSNDGEITGLSTGYNDLDTYTTGLQPGDLVIVAGRPSMGKTSFAMGITENAAVRNRIPVAVFSMEMPAEQLSMRMLSSVGRIDFQRLRTGKLGDDDWPRLTSAVSLMSEASIHIDDRPALTPSALRASAKRMLQEHNIGLVVIDYLQLMQSDRPRHNRTEEITEISRMLKALAKELNVPVIALSQLNRELEKRPNKRPVMSDLRESGGIEQDADVILFVYRDEVYKEDSPDKGTAEIIIGKQRNGPIGVVRLVFLGQYTRFENFVAEFSGQGNWQNTG